MALLHRREECLYTNACEPVSGDWKRDLVNPSDMLQFDIQLPLLCPRTHHSLYCCVAVAFAFCSRGPGSVTRRGLVVSTQARWVRWWDHMVRSCHQALRQMVPADRQDSEVAHRLSLSLSLAFLGSLDLSCSVSFSLTPTQLFISLFLHPSQSISLAL